LQTPGSPRGVAVALQLLDEMKQRGIQRSSHIYTCIMNICVRADRLQTALTMYESLLSEGLEPSLVTYHTLMDAYGQMRLWEKALTVLNVISRQVRAKTCHVCMAL
jgi:pentatricopeptide repeat protein